MAITLYSSQVTGLEAKVIRVEIDISPGLHNFSIVGLADKEVQESKERISAAIKNIGALPPYRKSQRITVNLAPADIRKAGPAFDLPIALGYLLVSKQIAFDPKNTIFAGELGLNGELRPISGVLPIALNASYNGFRRIILPVGNGREAAAIENIEVVEVENLSDVVEFLSGRLKLTPLPKTPLSLLSNQPQYAYNLNDIRGQESAKRGLEISAAGGHNIIMYGPPGGGKTMLARAITSILPPLTTEEALEVSKIYSITGLLNADHPFITTRPFRNPHHTSSHTSIIGGGVYPRPGEATLAHHGVLFLDEFPEFDRRVIEALRQPLEEKCITVSRAQGTETFPANFILVAAMNPCPCGNYGSNTKECVCSPSAVYRYKKKISGPILDRIDLHLEVSEVPFEKLEGKSENNSNEIKQKVQQAREIQRKRFENIPISTNSQMGIKEIKKFIKLDEQSIKLMHNAYIKYNLSARSYHRVLKIARTIADLETSPEVKQEHLFEALLYRPPQDEYS